MNTILTWPGGVRFPVKSKRRYVIVVPEGDVPRGCNLPHAYKRSDDPDVLRFAIHQYDDGSLIFDTETGEVVPR